ncbi:phage baseplate assembly protein V [Desulfitobacterium chlororespirans]|uniref:Phage baseplate assembly protein V n=1 Tax=Desulfitobacterium chlororespirans DSM 11544 TaxID=1121395 RepID=A0A1M7U2D4_9FIRM|nr:phage baseplate assembly protein V [Desulfitobacterium chlororespirans]SHN77201.1 phage baseplate assembly protein V [Desulfitobacterium chlororespirans DSM 11544]
MNERVGEVVSINPAKCRVRVRFYDQDSLISEELQVVVRGTLKNKDYWMPKVGEAVFCSFTAQNKGYVLGAVYSEGDPPPVISESKRHIEFEDGTILEYDSSDHTLSIECAGPINIVGNVTVSGDVLASGVSLKSHTHAETGGTTSPPNGGG